MNQLDTETKINILYDVKVNMFSNIHTAKLHKVSRALVSVLLTKLKQNPQYLQSLIKVDTLTEQKERHIIAIA